MNYTPTEARALARARTIAPMSDADRGALPIDSATWTPTQRRLAREHRLAHAAEVLRQRELQTALYRHALEIHDRQAKHDLRVTALDTSTPRLRADLLDAYRALLDLDDTPLFAYVPRNRP